MNKYFIIIYYFILIVTIQYKKTKEHETIKNNGKQYKTKQYKTRQYKYEYRSNGVNPIELRTHCYLNSFLFL